MAWNGSDSVGSSVPRKRATSTKSPRNQAIKKSNPQAIRHGLFAGLIVVALGGVALWWFAGRDIKRPSKVEQLNTKRDARIAEVTPHIATNQPQSEAIDYAELSGAELRRLPENETNHLNAAQVEYWKMFHPYPPPDKNQPKWSRPKSSIFKDRANNEIAFVLCTEPGSMIVTASNYDERFVKRFLRSLNTPIEISDEDGDYEREVKQAVIEARKELKAAYDRGEDVAEIMNTSRDDLKKLGQYRRDMETTAVDALKQIDNPTDNDVDDLIKAVNMSLEEKGIAPIEGTSISRIAARIQRRHMRKQEEKNQ